MKESLMCLFVVCCLQIRSVSSREHRIGIPSGTIIGFEDTVSGVGNVYIAKFLGIPYAETPTGKRRFSKPVPKPLSGVFNASSYGFACIQNDYLLKRYASVGLNQPTSEDCLTLNIFEPIHGSGNAASNKAVMVWFHGGGFAWGSSAPFDAGYLASYGDVIVVTVNYRLGVLGFLKTDNTSSSSNNGLWDQHLAVKWVSENIEYFGGDNKKITIFGQSAGAASVTYQALYPGNKGLFQKAISQSGVLSAPWASSKSVSENSLRLIKELQCVSKNRDDILECLRKLDVYTILETSDKLFRAASSTPTLTMIPFAPSFDGGFISYDPTTVLTNIKYLRTSPWGNIQFMTGINNVDGLLVANGILSKYLPGASKYGIPKMVYNNVLIPRTVQFYEDSKYASVITPLMLHQYNIWHRASHSMDYLRKYTNIITDYMFTVPCVASVTSHSKMAAQNNSSYLYLFRHNTKHRNPPSTFDAANHGDEIPYIFGFPNLLRKYYGYSNTTISGDARTFSNSLITYWTNFAKSG